MAYIPIFQFFLKRKVSKIIAFDRVARLSDIGMKDLSFFITGTYNIWIGENSTIKSKVYRIKVTYTDPRIRNINPMYYVGDYELDEIHNFSWVEEDIAKKINNVKSQPPPANDAKKY